MPGTPVSAAATLPYSSTVSPKMLTITFVSNRLSQGSFSARNAFTPTFCRPMAFNIPPVVSMIRGGGFPRRGSSEIPLTTTAPRRLRST
ncbi:MAG: hypothetical protein A4E67_01171 [Syntrophaceae bacterium PtaB.Bin038]|nr:MAG: hypothetical protein A4E67_01171 [Syntrophaceae bacterium PtaB.Bin038]